MLALLVRLSATSLYQYWKIPVMKKQAPPHQCVHIAHHTRLHGRQRAKLHGPSAQLES